MMKNFGGNGLGQNAQWFETNKYGLNKTSVYGLSPGEWFE